ncbi:MAG TPA: SDR family oxidoreductase [Acetobacteraceae bacterium]|nr:SDR family oxidoreductase [Acetobacteraceae bacterium]
MLNPNTALITGASAGIGAVYADRLAHRGHDLILVARDETRLNALAARLRTETGRSAEVLPADLLARPDLLRLEQRLREDRSIGILVNNAGVAAAGPMHGSDVDRLEAMVNLNVIAALRLAHAAIEGFVARGQGTLINICSVLALAPERLNATYSGSKAFLLNLSIGLRAELANTAIRIQAVLPGATRTDIWSKAGVDVATLPAGTVMDVEEMVDAALTGLDMGEAVTIPALPDMADWARFTEARLAMVPNLSRAHPAPRYRRSGESG